MDTMDSGTCVTLVTDLCIRLHFGIGEEAITKKWGFYSETLRHLPPKTFRYNCNQGTVHFVWLYRVVDNSVLV